MSQNVAVVTGANRGLGFAIVKALCKRYQGVVYLTSQNEKNGRNAVDDLYKLGLYPEYHQLDVTNRESVVRFRDHLKSQHGGLNIFINNAAILGCVVRHSYTEDKSVIDVNYNGPLNVHYYILPLLRDNGRVLNMSSDCGHLLNIRNRYWIKRLSKSDLNINDINEFVDWFLESSRFETFTTTDIADGGTLAAYRVSKVALSALTIVQQKKFEHKNVSVNSLNPGHIKTDMTEGEGDLTPDEAALKIVYLVLDAPATLKGSYIWHDLKVNDWYTK